MSVGNFTGLLQYFTKNRAILVQKLGREKNLSKSVSSILRKKPTATKLNFNCRDPLFGKNGEGDRPEVTYRGAVLMKWGGGQARGHL